MSKERARVYLYVTMAQEIAELAQQMRRHLERDITTADLVAAWEAEKRVSIAIDAARDAGEEKD